MNKQTNTEPKEQTKYVKIYGHHKQYIAGQK